MLKKPTLTLSEDFEKLHLMNPTQVMRAVNSQLDSQAINSFVSDLKTCQSPEDFTQCLEKIKQSICASLDTDVPDQYLMSCLSYCLSCAILRYVTLTIFDDLETFTKKLETSTENIKFFFLKYMTEKFEQEPLKSFFKARPDYYSDLVRTISLNFNVTQKVHIPKALAANFTPKERMAYYFASMMTNSANDLFDTLLNDPDIQKSLTPINAFKRPENIVKMAISNTPTSTCPIAHMDQKTRQSVIDLIEKASLEN